jgi:hypothetical protein
LSADGREIFAEPRRFAPTVVGFQWLTLVWFIATPFGR